MPYAYAYLRVSTEEQVSSGLGLEAQESAIRARYPDLDNVFCDEGITGADPNRPALMAAMEILGQGDVLVIAKRDRLARDAFLSAWIEKEVKRRGARIVSVAGEGTDDDAPASVLMRRMVDAFAEYERSMIGSRTSAALQAKRKRGEKTGGDVPYGYVSDKEGRLTPLKREQRAIAIIRELKTRGLSLRQIAAELEQRGVTTKRGNKRWQPRVIARLA